MSTSHFVYSTLSTAILSTYNFTNPLFIYLTTFHFVYPFCLHVLILSTLILSISHFIFFHFVYFHGIILLPFCLLPTLSTFYFINFHCNYSFWTSLRKNRQSVIQNHQISEMSGKFVSLPDSMKLIQKNAQTVFWVVWSSMDEDCTHFLRIFHQIRSVY